MTEVVDAYQEHVKRLRADADRDKICTLTLPQSEMAAIWKVIAEAIDSVEDLPAPAKRKWESILRSLGRSIQEAE